MGVPPFGLTVTFSANLLEKLRPLCVYLLRSVRTQRSPATGINFYNFYSAQRHNSCSKTMLLVFHFKSSGAYFSVMQKSGLFSFYLHFWNRRWLNMEKQKSNFGSPKFIVLGFPVPWRCFCFCTSPLPQDCPTEFYRSWLDGINLWNIGTLWSLFCMLTTVLYRHGFKCYNVMLTFLIIGL